MQNPGIYLSIPFCRQKCTYCNFASAAFPASLLDSYLRCLSSEITSRIPLWAQSELSISLQTPADTVYLGGGTPSLLPAPRLDELLQLVRSEFSIPKNSEITLEASPENVSPEQAAAWAASGVNRVSMGVQSMVLTELRAVGRMHSAQTVSSTFAALRQAGIENISVDLIAGLPLQTSQSWRDSIDSLLALRPTHFSVYMLEVDEDSNLGREILRSGNRFHASDIPSEDQIADFFIAACEQLREAGYLHYEISNFALPGMECRHNRKYWEGIPYFGFGVEAHSYDGTNRWANTDSLDEYLQIASQQKSPVVHSKSLNQKEKIEERLFLGLRQLAGISLSRMEKDFGVNPQNLFSDQFQEFAACGWLVREGDYLRLTDSGVLFSNEVFAGLIS
ncbi:MAG: hypothetical protein A3F68_06525 [Acidobacteria bacterium RIFCSPLOWO2_12_FULL_54_10]|nr:MAG: hypothetical protein A3F68_06525 [Acidobacteria bacterium RIFCSPLOWO2_12_FULL_54_10]